MQLDCALSLHCGFSITDCGHIEADQPGGMLCRKNVLSREGFLGLPILEIVSIFRLFCFQSSNSQSPPQIHPPMFVLGSSHQYGVKHF